MTVPTFYRCVDFHATCARVCARVRACAYISELHNQIIIYTLIETLRARSVSEELPSRATRLYTAVMCDCLCRISNVLEQRWKIHLPSPSNFRQSRLSAIWPSIRRILGTVHDRHRVESGNSRNGGCAQSATQSTAPVGGQLLGQPRYVSSLLGPAHTRQLERREYNVRWVYSL